MGILMPCLHETRLREVNAFYNSKMYNRDFNLSPVNVSRVNTVLYFVALL